MTSQSNHFRNNKQIAQRMYQLAETFIRSAEAAADPKCERKEGADPILFNEYQSNFDYYGAAIVLSQTDARQQNLKVWMEEETENRMCRNEIAYLWLKQTAAYEIASMWILDCFYNAYVERNDEAACWNGVFEWTKRRRNKDGGFIFFEYSNNPLFVR